jgi:hypothetical protein
MAFTKKRELLARLRDERARAEFLPLATRALCNGKIPSFKASVSRRVGHHRTTKSFI